MKRWIVPPVIILATCVTFAWFPITVKIVAWQFGRGMEPRVQTAQPVEQTIVIEQTNRPTL